MPTHRPKLAAGAREEQSAGRAEQAPAWRARLVRALSHPLRDHIVEILSVEGPATTAELAEATGRSRATIGRHLKVLEECAAVERVASVSGEGRMPATYRAALRSMIIDNDEWAEFPVAVRRELFRGDLRRIEQHVKGALGTGGFDRPDAHVSWSPGSLDPAAHREMVELLIETLERAVAIQAGADARRERGETTAAEAIDSEVVILHFERDRATVEEAREAGFEVTLSPSELRRRMYELGDEIGEQIPGEEPDWYRVAARARELSALAEQYADALEPVG